MKRPPDNLPNCPNCHRKPWRSGRGITIEVAVPDHPAEGAFTVCMHCSSIWALEGGRWRKPTAQEWASVGPSLMPIALRFLRQRIDAAHLTAGRA